MTWYELKSLPLINIAQVEKMLGHAIDFFDFNIIFYMIALFYRLGWKVSASGFIFLPTFIQKAT